MFIILKTDYFQLWFLYNNYLRLLQENIKESSELNTYRRQYRPHVLSDKGCKGTVVSRALKLRFYSLFIYK